MYDRPLEERPLLKKLGFQPNQVSFVDSVAPYYAEVESFMSFNAPTPYDFIHIFVRNQAELHQSMDTSLIALGKTGMLWVSWPKQSSKVPTDLNENVIRDYGLSQGIVDVKVAAIDDVWSALKFVYRLKDR